LKLLNHDKYNPLPNILKLLPIDKLHWNDVSEICKELERGGVVCEDIKDFFVCIRTLETLGFLDLEEQDNYYRINKKYGE
jgi:hypothetical protein